VNNSHIKERQFKIGSSCIGENCPVYIIAEMSANHHGSLDEALQLVYAAKQSGANALKLQTYTASTLTLDSTEDCFRVGKGTVWEGRTLHSLYSEAYTPWEWHGEIKNYAESLGLDCFSSPFDATAVAFLETLSVPAYKIASFELVDIPLIQAVARTKKPLILSTGMGTLQEITEAVEAFHQAGGEALALLKCTSAYPAEISDMNLLTIPDLASKFNLVTGLSDHSMDVVIPITAVCLGAKIIEKHLTISRSIVGPDSSFSLEPQEFAEMVAAIRKTEAAVGNVSYSPTDNEAATRLLRRSLFVTAAIQKGEVFTAENLRSIRPAHGLHTRYLPIILGTTAACAIAEGKPLSEAHLCPQVLEKVLLSEKQVAASIL